MGLEAATNIAGLNANWPLGTDPKAQGDDHLRIIKAALKFTFPAGWDTGPFPSLFDKAASDRLPGAMQMTYGPVTDVPAAKTLLATSADFVATGLLFYGHLFGIGGVSSLAASTAFEMEVVGELYDVAAAAVRLAIIDRHQIYNFGNFPAGLGNSLKFSAGNVFTVTPGRTYNVKLYASKTLATATPLTLSYSGHCLT